MHPGQMLLGIGSVGGLLVLYSYLAKNQRVVNDLKRNHPVLCVVAILGAGYLVVHLVGSVLVFIFGVLLPISGKFSSRLSQLLRLLLGWMDSFNM